MYCAENISLLEQSDFQNNVLVFTSNLSDNTQSQQKFKSDGHLLSLTYMNNTSLLAIEQIESMTSATRANNSVSIYRYDFPGEQLLSRKMYGTSETSLDVRNIGLLN